jgi:hypothetical protein
MKNQRVPWWLERKKIASITQMKEPLDCKTARLYYRKKSRLQRYEDALLLVTKNIEKLENRIVSLDDRLNEISKQHNSAVMWLRLFVIVTPATIPLISCNSRTQIFHRVDVTCGLPLLTHLTPQPNGPIRNAFVFQIAQFTNSSAKKLDLSDSVINNHLTSYRLLHHSHRKALSLLWLILF